jgi:UDP-glucose 4-epimerase
MVENDTSLGTVLLAGGRGYLGSRLAVHLAQAGWRVLVGSRSASPLPFGDGLPMEPCVIDWEDADSLAAACQGCDAVVHLAAPNEIIAGEDHLEAVRGTVLTTIGLLAAARKNGCMRFIYFSTAHVYGSPLGGILSEGHPGTPLHPYAIAHRCAEDFVIAEKGKTEMLPVVVRLSNALGAPLTRDHDRWKLVGNDLCRQAVEKGHLTLLSDGSALRDFIPIRDVFLALNHILGLAPQSLMPVYNFSSGSTRSIRDIVGMVSTRWEARGNSPLPVSYGVSGKPPHPFVIPADLLIGSGFAFQSSLEEEIDFTLDQCELWFARPMSQDEN